MSVIIFAPCLMFAEPLALELEVTGANGALVEVVIK